MVMIDFKLGAIHVKLESSEAYLLKFGKNILWDFEVIYIFFCKNLGLKYIPISQKFL